MSSSDMIFTTNKVAKENSRAVQSVKGVVFTNKKQIIDAAAGLKLLML